MVESEATASPPTSDGQEPVWTYRGYRMKPGEFNTAMVHFYRGEITRANTWRGRLDSTTNWAVVTVAAIWLFFILGGAWLVKLLLHSSPTGSVRSFINNAAIRNSRGRLRQSSATLAVVKIAHLC